MIVRRDGDSWTLIRQVDGTMDCVTAQPVSQKASYQASDERRTLK